MRFFRTFEYLNELLKSLVVSDSVERILSLIKAFSLMLWMLMDHIQWLTKAGYLKVELKEIDKLHSKFWAIGLAFGCMISLYKMNKARAKIESAKAELRNLRTLPITDAIQQQSANLTVECTKQTAAFDKARAGLIKSAIDLVIPVQRLQWLPFSDSTAGVAGTITSIIGIMDTFPAAK